MPTRSELDKVRLNLDGGIRILQAVAEDLAKFQRTVERNETPTVDLCDGSGENCTTCGASLGGGEGYDGLCGPCVDHREPLGEEGPLDAAFEDRVNGGCEAGPCDKQGGEPAVDNDAHWKT